MSTALPHTCGFSQRDCESDQEEEIMKRRPRTRKRSSTSWELCDESVGQLWRVQKGGGLHTFSTHTLCSTTIYVLERQPQRQNFTSDLCFIFTWCLLGQIALSIRFFFYFFYYCLRSNKWLLLTGTHCVCSHTRTTVATASSPHCSLKTFSGVRLHFFSHLHAGMLPSKTV